MLVRPSQHKKGSGYLSPRGRAGGGFYDSPSASIVKRAMRATSNRVGRQVTPGLLGGILGGGRRR
jgi:hypothetical protein